MQKLVLSIINTHDLMTVLLQEYREFSLKIYVLGPQDEISYQIQTTSIVQPAIVDSSFDSKVKPVCFQRYNDVKQPLDWRLRPK